MSEEELAKKYIGKINDARSRHIDFTLSFNDYKNLLKRTKCYYTGVTLVPGTATGTQPDNAFTLDRKDSNVGYTKENTVPCSNRVNQIKSAFNKDIKLAEKILKKIKQ